MKTYSQFINESVRDLMKPKSEEEIRKSLNLSNKTPQEKLLIGAQHGVLWLVKEAIEEGVNINKKYNHGWTILMEASYTGILEIVKYLVDNGAKINSKNNSEFTPLMCASAKGHLDVVKYLIKNGADLNIKDCDGKTALAIALISGKKEVVDYLVQLGKTNKTNESVRDLMKPKSKEDIKKSLKMNKKTPNEILRLGIDKNIPWLIQYAIEEGVDINTDINYKFEAACTPLIYASHIGNLDMVKYLVKNGADINHKSNRKTTALIIASREGHLDIVKYLLENGADTNIQDVAGWSALLFAANRGYLRIVKYLVENGANISIKDNNNGTALDITSNKRIVNYLKHLDNTNESIRSLMKPKSEEEVLNALKKVPPNKKLKICSKEGIIDGVIDALEKGANVHGLEEYSQKEQPLCDACHNGYLEIVKILVDAGANIHVYNDYCLKLACFSKNLKLIKYLLDNGMVDYEQKCTKWAEKYGYYDIVKLIKKYKNIKRKRVNESIRDLMKPKSKEEIFKSLGDLTPDELFKKGDWEDQEWLIIEAIERGFDVEADNKEGLQIIVRQNFSEVVEYLLKKGIDFSPHPDFQPFYIAAMNGHIEIIRLLIKYGVKLNPISIQVASPKIQKLLQDYYNKTN